MINQYKISKEKISEVLDLPNANWINVSQPVENVDFQTISDAFQIPIDFFTDSLDIDERSRFEQDDEHKLIVVKTPTLNHSFNDSDAIFITIPICIIFSQKRVITVNAFEQESLKSIFSKISKSESYKTSSVFLLIYEKVIQNFLQCLKEINHKRNLFEQQLYDANRNEELLELMRIQKSLVYLVTALRSNELLMLKLERTSFITLDEDEKEHLRDLIVDTSQALEMANIYTNILSSSLDAFASLISNNQNQVLKRLTSITIIIQLPALIISIYGMNVPIPYQHSGFAFYIPVFISVTCSVLIAYFFQKKKWF